MDEQQIGGLITLWYAQYFPKISEIVGKGKGKGKYLEWKSRIRAANDDRFKGTRGFHGKDPRKRTSRVNRWRGKEVGL